MMEVTHMRAARVVLLTGSLLVIFGFSLASFGAAFSLLLVLGAGVAMTGEYWTDRGTKGTLEL